SRLFEQSLCDDRVKLIATRDARSAERLQHRIPGVSTKTIAVADPGVLADEVYTRSEKQFDLGLGVTEIGVLRRHSERHRSISTEALIERWVELARLCCQHYETALFT